MFEAYKRYADFTGRASRSEYWLYALFIFLVAIGLSVLMMLTSLGGGQPNGLVLALYGIFWLANIVPSLAVGFRRLHDTDRSAWWLCIAFVPLIGSIALIVFYCLPGTPGPNRFGPPPGAPQGQLGETFA